jgi:hypothetical protein
MWMCKKNKLAELNNCSGMVTSSTASTLVQSATQSLQSLNTMTQSQEGVTTGKPLVLASDPRNRQAVTRTTF